MSTRRIIQSAVLVFVLACTAYSAPIMYSFTATTRAMPGSPSHSEAFELVVPDFLPVTENGNVISFVSSDPAVISCTACVAPPTNAMHFLRGGSGDSIQFVDADGTSRFYLFPSNVLSMLGTFDTLPGINVNVGTVTVWSLSDGASAPEPSTWGMLGCGLAAVILSRFRRLRNF